MPKKGKLCIGTSGWAYDWENFYSGISAKEKLKFYAGVFNSTEINYSFYQLPEAKTYQKWVRETPDDFVFALKLSRLITHIRRLKGAKVFLSRFLKRAQALGKKLGPLFVQLPPRFAADAERLREFLFDVKNISDKIGILDLRLGFEFRHESWFNDPEVLEILKTEKAVFVFPHSSVYPYPQSEPQTADFFYFRFHGPGELFASRYGREGLKPWAVKIKKILDGGNDVYAYFNNDVSGYAADDARELMDLIK